MVYYRLDLNSSELENLKEIWEYVTEYAKIKEEEIFLSSSLYEKIQKPKEIKYSGKKAIAVEKATETRTKKAKEKIEKAVEILKKEGEKITPYRISKVSGVSFVTVKKYLNTSNEN